jgi:predicted enzyme related to lactoylglutathione lyase
MNEVQVEGTNYQMPPVEGMSIAHFLTVADVDRSAQFYAKVFDGKIIRKAEQVDDPTYIQIANTWLILNLGGGPTPDKPTVILETPPDPNRISSFMNIRVANIVACYELWKSRGATFITEPLDKSGETRCYIRDPDGYIIEVGESYPGSWG